MNNLDKNILSTLIYYDILDYPLTVFEVWKYLGADKNNQAEDEIVAMGDVMEELTSNEKLKKRIVHQDGFYFLRGRSELVEKRLEKNKISERKFKIIKQVVFWLRFLPYVRLVAVTGTVAMKNASNNSDLDLLIALKQRRIFLGRTLVTGAVQLMGKRRYGKKIANRICLNCFLTDKSLESRLKDAFSSSEYFFAVPIFGQKVFGEFQRENSWIKEFKPNFSPQSMANLKMLCEAGRSRKIRQSLEIFFDMAIFDKLESRLEKWQTERIVKDPRTKEVGSIIMADSEALIFFHRAHSLAMDKLFQQRLAEAALD